MAKCQTCGTEVSFFNINRECESCERTRFKAEQLAAEERAAREAEEQRRREEREAAERVAAAKRDVEQLQADVVAYGATTLTRSFSLDVDSFINGDLTGFFSLAALQPCLRRGWQIVATIPRTKGVALHNTQSGSFGTHYGGGMGGNVIGVHVVLQLVVTPQSLPQQLKAIEEHFAVMHGGTYPVA